MNWLFGALHLQGIEFETVWPVSDRPGREGRSLGSQLLPLPGASGGGQGLRASSQEPQDDPDFFEASQPKTEKGGWEERDLVVGEAEITFQLP